MSQTPSPAWQTWSCECNWDGETPLFRALPDRAVPSLLRIPASSKAVFAQNSLGHAAHCPHSLLGGLFLGAGCWAFGLSKPARNWRGYLMHKNAKADGLEQKSIANRVCTPASMSLSFCFAGPTRGARQAGARWAAGMSSVRASACQTWQDVKPPWGYPHVHSSQGTAASPGQSAATSQHIPSC